MLLAPRVGRRPRVIATRIGPWALLLVSRGRPVQPLSPRRWGMGGRVITVLSLLRVVRVAPVGWRCCRVVANSIRDLVGWATT